MKTDLRFRALWLLIALSLGIFINSCTKEEPTVAPETNNSENLQLKSVTTDPPEDTFCDLIAGQTINTGQVLFSHDATNLYVTYLTSNGWTLTEVHLYVGTLAGLPTNKTAIKIGQFPYSATNLNVTQFTFTIPLANLQKDANGYAIFAHAVVINGTQQETAWSNNCTYKPIITVKSKFLDNGNETWAATDGVHYPNNTWYCPWLGTNIYEKGAEYLLQSWIYPLSSGGAGKVNVTDDGTNLFVVVTPKVGLTLKATYLYVGSMAGLEALGQYTGGCPNYYDFLYQSFDATPTHTFKIPMPMQNSISFESIWGKGRWGWFSYYNF